ncbi:hypothetical protein [Iodobacter ciconiae]|uniref:ATP-binding protein n=1 Tax=Iodobacter ciconiae TaxID=2496266 RepID=A0A3S8ZQ11_9NEIS|nr:hypothetical protein [Iodobacter ciconiae]AZN35554.1 hypothetical protein EJO50_03065 [Iodobacter ciconiae]
MSGNLHWHYPRNALAQTLFQLWENELTDSITLTAPPLSGKSQFLQEDLLPLLEKKGWRVRYFACSQVPQKYLETRLHEVLVDFAMGERWLSHQLRQFMGTSTTASPLAALFSQMRKGHKPCVLLLDDAGLLLKKDNSTALLKELFNAMQINGQQIKLLLASTDLNPLNCPTLFTQNSSRVTLPDIGNEFIDHLLGLYSQLTQSVARSGQINNSYEGITWGQMDHGSLMQAFKTLQRSPAAMRSLIEELVLDPEKSLPVALKRQIQLQQRHSMADLDWEDLGRLGRLLLLAIAEGRQQLYGKSYRDWLAEQTGKSAISASQIQSCLKKMQRNKVIALAADHWHIVDAQLARLLRHQQENKI